MRVLIAVLFAVSLALAPPDLQVHRDIAYAEPENERQTLDLYAPSEGTGHPVVFWIHGGGWQRGDKSDVHIKPEVFGEKGFVFVSTNYRFLPNATIKEMAQDVAKAIRWVYDHAEEYGGDPNRILIMGHSAGAQLGALVCTDDRYLKAEGLSLSIIKGCVPIDGDTYNVPFQIATVKELKDPREAVFERKFGDETSQKELSPVTHVASGKNIPPFLLMHITVNPETGLQAQILARALQEAGIPATVVAGEGKTHESIHSDLGLPNDAPTQALYEFMDAALKMDR